MTPTEQKAFEQMRDALETLLKRDKRNTCQHEETHRGGVIWEICEGCGMKWADDRGGKPKWKNPTEWDAAESALTAANAVSHAKPENAPATEGGAITFENDDADMLAIAYMDGFDAGKKSVQPLGWYCVSRDGLATQCADQRDAELTAKSANRDWPNSAPYRAVQLCEFEAHPQATEPAWRPIESAPKDGTWVLAINAKTNPTRQHVVRYFDDAAIYPWKTGSGHMDWVAGLTHWLPLPAAPEAKQ